MNAPPFADDRTDTFVTEDLAAPAAATAADCDAPPASGGAEPWTVERADGLSFVADDAAFTIPLGALDTDLLAGHIGRPVDLGFRPENLSLAPLDAATSAPITVELDVVEPMGNEIVLYGRAGTPGTHALVARVAPQAVPEPGQKLVLHADVAKLHFFDAETEASLRVQPEAVTA